MIKWMQNIKNRCIDRNSYAEKTFKFTASQTLGQNLYKMFLVGI